ncbi:hypothetical protein GGF31_004698 [Allomyces arbusculus]|nr:hypothetical protein GGF31_004698 [Allomyces arbusculus]
MMSSSARRAIPPAAHARTRPTCRTRLGLVLAVVLAVAAATATTRVLARPDPRPGPDPAPNPNPNPNPSPNPGPGPDPLAAPAPRPDPLPLPDPATGSVFGFLSGDDHLAWAGPNPAPLYVPVDDLHRRRQSPSEVLAHVLLHDDEPPAPEPSPVVPVHVRPTGTDVLDEEIPAAAVDEVGHVVDLDDGVVETVLVEPSAPAHASPGPTPSQHVDEDVVFDPVTPFDPASAPSSIEPTAVPDHAGPTPFDDQAILPPPSTASNVVDDAPAIVVDADRVCAPEDLPPPARNAPDVLFLADRDVAVIDWTESTPPPVPLSARAATVLARINPHHTPSSCADMGNHRGFTAGIGAFTTRDGDLLAVFTRFRALSGSDELREYEEVLADLAGFRSPDTGMIPHLCCAWIQTMRDSKLGPQLVQAQRDVNDRLVVWPAMETAHGLGPLERVPLIQAHLVDAARVHGANEMRAMVERVVNGTVKMTRDAFVAGMVKERAAVVSEAEDAARVVCLAKWADAGEWELKGALKCEVASGDVVEIEKEGKEIKARGR